MPRYFLQSSVFFLLFTLVIFVQLFHAQNNSCDLQLEVIENSQVSPKETPVNGASATLRSKSDEKIIESVLKNENPYFSQISEGKYTLEITKKGYKTTVKEIALDCNAADQQGVVTEIILLWKGKSKEKISMKASAVNFGKLIKMAKPEYPEEARKAKVSGTVQVRVLVDELGNVISATAVSGHPLLHASAVNAALASKFSPTILKGKPVKFRGSIIFNFVPR